MQKGWLCVLLQDKSVGRKQGSEFGGDVVWSVGTYPFRVRRVKGRLYHL